MRRRQLALAVVAAVLVGTGVAGCGHSSNGASGPSVAPSHAASAATSAGPGPNVGSPMTATTDVLLAAVQAAAKPGTSTLYLGAGTGSQALDVADNGAASFRIAVSCAGAGATFDSGGKKFFQTSQCGGKRAVYGADVPRRYLQGGHITIVAPSGTAWAVEIASSQTAQ